MQSNQNDTKNQDPKLDLERFMENTLMQLRAMELKDPLIANRLTARNAITCIHTLHEMLVKMLSVNEQQAQQLVRSLDHLAKFTTGGNSEPAKH